MTAKVQKMQSQTQSFQPQSEKKTKAKPIVTNHQINSKDKTVKVKAKYSVASHETKAVETMPMLINDTNIIKEIWN